MIYIYKFVKFKTIVAEFGYGFVTEDKYLWRSRQRFVDDIDLEKKAKEIAKIDIDSAYEGGLL